MHEGAEEWRVGVHEGGMRELKSGGWRIHRGR